MPKANAEKIKRIRRANAIAKKAKQEKPLTNEESNYISIIQQIEDEFQLAWRTLRPKITENLKRLKLYNNQKRDKNRVGDPLIYTIFQTILAVLYTDRLETTFGGREEGDEDMAENLNGLAEFDFDEMDKPFHDHDWIWDAMAFGRGLSYFDDFDRNS